MHIQGSTVLCHQRNAEISGTVVCEHGAPDASYPPFIPSDRVLDRRMAKLLGASNRLTRSRNRRKPSPG